MTPRVGVRVRVRATGHKGTITEVVTGARGVAQFKVSYDSVGRRSGESRSRQWFVIGEWDRFLTPEDPEWRTTPEQSREANIETR